MTGSIKPFSEYAPPALYALYRDVYSSSDAMSESLDEKYPSLDAFEADIAALQRLPGAVALAAGINGKPTAYVTIRPRKPARLQHTADLNMGVASEARGKGLGRLALEAALAQATASPALEILYLMVRADNSAAIRLYETCGFETLAVLNRDIRIANRYFDGLLMRAFVRRSADAQASAV